MRLLLIRPPSHNTIETSVPKAVEAENTSYPPLGLLALATWLRQNSDHDVAILDAQLDELDQQQLAERIRRHAPEVVGVVAYTVQLVDVVHTVQAARGCSSVPPGGGGAPHSNPSPARARPRPGGDAAGRGEGQQPLLQLLDVWQRGDEPRGLPGAMAHPDDPIPSAPALLSDDLDSYPIPDRTLVDFRRYSSLLGTGGLFTTVATSRGCPHQCTFCNTPRTRFRSASPGRICEEIEACLALDIREIYFVDDTFNVTNERVHQLCDEILARRLSFSWTVRMRVNGVDQALLEKMKAAGCTRVQLGVEQGTDEGLRRLRKGVTTRDIEQAFRLCRQVGLSTVAYFMIGTPTERSRLDVLRTIRYAIRLEPDFLMVNILTPFPGTRLYDEGLEEGVLSLEPWMAFMRDPRPGFQPPIWEEHFTGEQLRSLLLTAYRAFYWRPAFVMGQLRELRQPIDLARKARAGLRLLLDR